MSDLIGNWEDRVPSDGIRWIRQRMNWNSSTNVQFYGTLPSKNVNQIKLLFRMEQKRFNYGLVTSTSLPILDIIHGYSLGTVTFKAVKWACNICSTRDILTNQKWIISYKDANYNRMNLYHFYLGCLPVIMWFLFGEVSSSSGCLGWATLFYCGTP